MRRGGPIPHLLGNSAIMLEQGLTAFKLHRFGAGLTYEQIGQHLGVSATTAWRRAHFYGDWVGLATFYGHAPGPRPPQRGTRACPRGTPCVVPLHHPELRRPANRPAVRCTARRKRDGEPCQRWAVHGGRVCPSHGGSAPQVRRAAAERHAVAQARRAATAAVHRHHH